MKSSVAMARSASRLTLVLCVAAFAAIVAMFAFRRLSAPVSPATQGGAAVEGFGTNKKLVVIHAQWCGHCKELLKSGGVWEEVKSKLPGVPVQEIDEAGSPEIVKKLDVTSFPDIRVMDGDESVAKFDGERTADAIVDFAMENTK